MRVLIFTTDQNKDFETFVRNHFDAIQQSHTVKMVFLQSANLQNGDSFTLEDKSSTIFVRSLAKAFLVFPFLRKILLSGELNKICAAFNPAILHFHFGTRTIKYFNQYKLPTSTPIFITFHGIDASHFLKASTSYQLQLKQLFKLENVFPLFVAEALLKNVEQYGISSPRSQVCHLGIDCNFYKPDRTSQIKTAKKTFIQIARLDPKKGHLHALRAFHKIHTAIDAQFIIVGDGPMKAEIANEIVKLDLSSVVKMLPGCNQAAVNAHLESADYFIHASCESLEGNMEGIPTVIMEAMAMELPILSTYHSGIPELVEHSVNGLLSEERNVDQLAEHMLKIVDWGKLLVNREKIVQHFNLEKQNELLASYYEKALVELKGK